MKKILCLGAAVACLIAAPCMAATEIREGDAFARSDSGHQTWTIGTSAVQMTYACKDGQLRLESFQNRVAQPPREYASPSAVFDMEAIASGSFALEKAWTKPLVAGSTMDPAADNLHLDVKQGDLIGFGVMTGADDGGATVNWMTALEYGDGEKYTSSDDTALDQGPVWYYYTYAPGTGSMDLLGEILPPVPPAQNRMRVPTGFRAPAECSRLGGTEFRLINAHELIRVWKAPKDGAVNIKGIAESVAGSAGVTLDIFRIADSAARPIALPDGYGRWTVESGTARGIAVGGRPAVQLDLVLNRDGLRAHLHVQAHPGSAILRQWTELENTTASPIRLDSPTSLRLDLNGAETADLTHYWMCGGTSRPNQGQLESAEVADTYHRTLLGDRTDNYVPWMALTRENGPGDGLFVTLDHLGTWTLGFDCAAGQAALSATFPALTGYSLAAGERLKLPLVTLGVFDGDLDDMGRRVYDWQYEYLWDYTNSDYYARTKWVTPWFFCSRNLQEQFAARLAALDMDADLMRTLGMEMLWDDAGWSKYPGWPIPDNYSVVFSPSNEGPDFAETLRYLDKMDMKWLLWMAGRPTPGLLDTMAASWGDFQWRTDGFGRFGLKGEQAMRVQIERFLQSNPRCSFHTCCGGSRYAHQFEIQRYADVNYLSDMGRGDQTNYYLSYLELPDKWVDLLEALQQPGNRYNVETGHGMMSMTPGWYLRATEGPEQDQLRRLMEIYRYLRREGVAGRWSHSMHPSIEGDTDYYYFQRISFDGRKACIIPKHLPKGTVTIRPKGLVPEHNYEVAYECSPERLTRTGADLMANGIILANPAAGELVYLGLPDMPGIRHDSPPPGAPGQAFARNETNLGHSGVGLYWAAADDGQWISYYEISRDEVVIGKASVGTYYFDHSPGWNAAARYAVRAVTDNGRQAGEWTPAKLSGDGAPAYAALGGLFPQSGRDGWRAETTADGVAFAEMAWVAPAKSPAGDTGGTPNQPGGVEGYWEGPGFARVGRGWQQASTEVACVRSWTAPTAGALSIMGRAIKECYHQAMGEPLRVRILHGDKQVWPEQGWAEAGLNNLQGAAHNLKIDVAAGDVIRFVLDRGTSPENDIVAWMPRIAYESKATEAGGDCVRILCGVEQDYTDANGNVWAADRFFSGGAATATESPITGAQPTANDAALYQHGRTANDFAYAIPVKPGIYTVRLKFAEPKYAWSFERPFNVTINGRRVLENFDICQAARGLNRAYERVFRNLVPDKNGNLLLRFTGGFEPMQKTGEALVQAIEVLPEIKPPVRIDAGADREFIDWNSFIWAADADSDAGTIIRSDAAVSYASPTLYDQRLYQTARSGKVITCSVPVSPGLYAVHLKFAELWMKEPGQRPMCIEIGGRVVRDNWDPATAAGQLGMAADIRVEDVAPDKDNRITICVRALGANDAILQGIEIE